MNWDRILSLLFVAIATVITVLQYRAAVRHNKADEALDWSMTAKNLREENEKLRDDLKNLHKEFSVIKDLARRLIKNPPERGEVIVLSPIEQALLFDTSQKIKKGEA